LGEPDDDEDELDPAERLDVQEDENGDVRLEDILEALRRREDERGTVAGKSGETRAPEAADRFRGFPYFRWSLGVGGGI
jgi:hypothetical protein